MGSRSPLLEALNNMAGTLPMHMPGHKRNAFWGSAASLFSERKVYDLDFTEVPGLDDLHAPEGVIAEAQDLAADCFKAKHSFFLVNGASVGITAAILSCCQEGDKVLVPRNAHRCVYEGLVLSGAAPVYFQPEYNCELSVPLSPDRRKVAGLIAGEQPKALILVHPTYQGAGCDLNLIREASAHHVVTIVDEAHGPHFSFDDRLPRSAVEAAADIIVHSTHKTLGSLTQTGLLHLGTEKLNPQHVGNVLSLLQSTSPSYVLMASLDAMRAQLSDSGRAIIGRSVDLALELREAIGEIDGFSCAELGGSNGWDPTKILLQASFMNGFELGETLRRDFGIYAEMEEDSFILLMLTVGDTSASIARLVEALRVLSSQGIKAKGKGTEKALSERNAVYSRLPEVVITPRQAFQSEKKKCELEKAVGRLSGSLIVPYPPGVPLVCPGERVSRELVEYLYFIKANKAHVQGLASIGENGEKLGLLVLEC